MITVAYGQYVEGHGWARTTMNSQRIHLVKTEPYNRISLCGLGGFQPGEYTSGTMCPKCARLANIKSAADLAVDEQEYSWMKAQKDLPADG